MLTIAQIQHTAVQLIAVTLIFIPKSLTHEFNVRDFQSLLRTISTFYKATYCFSPIPQKLLQTNFNSVSFVTRLSLAEGKEVQKALLISLSYSPVWLMRLGTRLNQG